MTFQSTKDTSPNVVNEILAELSIQNTAQNGQDLDYNINKNEVIQLIEDSYLTTI